MLIAICGTERNSGATHFALSLSQYLCNKMRSKVAYVELNATDEIARLGPTPLRESDSFKINGITLFAKVTLGALPKIYALSFDYFILDLGVLNNQTFREFIRADEKFVIGFCSPWKESSYQSFFRKYKDYQVLENTFKLEPMGSSVQTKTMVLEDGQVAKIQCVPYLDNPFHLTSENIGYLSGIVRSFSHFTTRRKEAL